MTVPLNDAGMCSSEALLAPRSAGFERSTASLGCCHKGAKWRPCLQPAKGDEAIHGVAQVLVLRALARTLGLDASGVMA